MTKLERAKQFLRQKAGPGLRVISLAMLAASAYAGTVFDVTGTFDNTSTLSGTITIDTIGGTVTDSNLTIDPVALDYTFTGGPTSQGAYNSSGFYYYQAEFQDGSANLYLDFSTSSLVGFTGASLCSIAQPCNNIVSSYYFNVFASQPADPDLVSGDVAPEPSTALLLVGGGAVLALRRRKRSA